MISIGENLFGFGGAITGDYDEVIGNGVGNNITSGSFNVIIGGTPNSGSKTAGLLTTGGTDVVIGNGAFAAATTASNSTVVGYAAAKADVSAALDAFGLQACDAETTNSALCVGANAGQNATGTSDTFVGEAAGQQITAANNVTIIGSNAGLNENSSNVSYFGAAAGRRAAASAGSNEAFGYNEFYTSSGGGSEQYDAFFGDSSTCGGCTNSISFGHAAQIGGTSVTHAVQLDTGTNSTSHTMQWRR